MARRGTYRQTDKIVKVQRRMAQRIGVLRSSPVTMGNLRGLQVSDVVMSEGIYCGMREDPNTYLHSFP